MKRASRKFVGGSSRAALAIAAAVSGVVASNISRAATLTWTGAFADPDSANYVTTTQGTNRGFTSGQNLYLWNTSATNSNWTGASKYTVGDNVIFTDNFAGGTDIRLSSGNLNPTSITFSHIAGASPVTYRFINSSGTVGSADFYTDGTQTANVTNNTPFGAAASTTLTLDTGFLGTVMLGHRSNAAVTFGNTIVRSGILEINDGGALPHSNNQNQPTLTLDGGEFRVKVNTNGNTNPAAAQIGGTLTVLSNSTLSNGEATRTAANQGATLWNGPVTMGAGITLTLKSYTTVRANLSNMNITNVAGTIKLADVGANVTVIGVNNGTAHDALNALIDIGTDSSELQNTGGNLEYNWGALQGGANTKISGSPTTAGTGTFSVGSRGDSTTFAGILRDNPVFPTGLAALTKVGTGTMTLSGTSTHTGPTIARGGTLLLSGAAGALSNSAVTIDQGGTFSVNNTTNSNTRLSDSAALTMNQGTLTFQGNLATPTSESVGALTIAGGGNVVQTTATGVGSPATLTFASLARTAGVVDFQPNANVNIALTASSPVNGILGGYSTVNQNDWAGLSGSNIVVYSGYTANTAPGTWAAAQNINLTTGGTSTVAASANINSLRFAGAGTAVSISAGQILNIGTGGVLATGTGGASISGAGTLTAGAAAAELIVTVPTVGNTLTISAPIADNGGGAVTLVKAGAGKLFLNGSGSTYTGGTQLIGGTLQVGVANFFPAGSNLTINYGTSFDIGGFNQTFGTVALIDGSLLNTLGAAAVTATTYDVRKGTITAALAGGAGVLNKTTGDTVTLSGANTYAGGTNVSAGTLTAGAANTLPSGGAVTITGGSVNVGAFNQSIGVLQVGNSTTSAGTITGTTGVITPSSVDAQNGTISGIIGGSTGITKANINTTVTLSGMNTYTGATVINSGSNSGTLVITNLANGGSASSLGASTNAAANLNLGGVSVLSYTGTGGSTDRLFTLAGNVSIGSNGTGAISFTNTGAVTGGFNGTLTLTGSNTGNNTFALLMQPGDVGAVTKGGAGTWIVTNDNTYTGITTIGGGTTSTLSVAKLANGGVAQPLGAATNAASQLVLNNGTLKYTGTGHSTDRLFTLNNSSTIDASGSGAANFTNTGAMGGPGTALILTLTGTNTGANTIAAAMGGQTAITKTGAGSWTLSGNNTFTGATTVSAGTLNIQGALKTTASITVGTSTLKVLPQANPYNVSSEAGTNKTATVSITSGGVIDLTNTKLITQDASMPTTPVYDGVNDIYTYSGVHRQVQLGRGDGTWNGTIGIKTSQTDATTGILTSLAVGSGSELRGLGATQTELFAGQTINGNSTVVMYTYGGDADMDGDLDGDDYFWIDSFATQSETVFGWHQGDFNYDGRINGDDYFVIDSNTAVAQGSGNVFWVRPPEFSSGSGGLTAVPEPASLGLLGLAATGLMSRRRRQRSE